MTARQMRSLASVPAEFRRRYEARLGSRLVSVGVGLDDGRSPILRVVIREMPDQGAVEELPQEFAGLPLRVRTGVPGMLTVGGV